MKAKEIAKEIISTDTMILCMCVIFSIVVTNYIVFLIVHKYTGMAEKRLERNKIQPEIYKMIISNHKKMQEDAMLKRMMAYAKAMKFEKKMREDIIEE